MMGKTHSVIGMAATSVYLANTANKGNNIALIIGILVAGYGSLMPDIDIKNSKASHMINKLIIYVIIAVAIIRLLPLSIYSSLISTVPIHINQSHTILGIIILASAIIFSKLTGHRAFSHSILGVVAFVLGIFFLYKEITIPFAIGYVFHLIADFFTDEGIMIFFPLKKRMSLHLIKTGSSVEYLISLVSIIILIFSFC